MAGAAGRHIGLGGLLRGHGVDVLLLADGVGVEQRLVALGQRRGLRQRGLGARQRWLARLRRWPGRAPRRCWNSSWPAFTSLPSVNMRFCRMPAARARTCATREASSRPGSSVARPTACGATVITPTSAGGGAPPPGGPPAPSAGFCPHAAASNEAANTTSEDCRDVFQRRHAETLQADARCRTAQRARSMPLTAHALDPAVANRGRVNARRIGEPDQRNIPATPLDRVSIHTLLNVCKPIAAPQQ